MISFVMGLLQPIIERAINRVFENPNVQKAIEDAIVAEFERQLLAVDSAA